jgi:hypothetical protein
MGSPIPRTKTKRSSTLILPSHAYVHLLQLFQSLANHACPIYTQMKHLMLQQPRAVQHGFRIKPSGHRILFIHNVSKRLNNKPCTVMNWPFLLAIICIYTDSASREACRPKTLNAMKQVPTWQQKPFSQSHDCHGIR